ncbi:MAG: FecR family protein [Methylovulum sp.]|nr:FecR family protein [Methylovulum sp.]
MKIPQMPSSSDDAVAEQAMVWFVRLRSDSASEQQQAQFVAWLAADPAHQQAYRELETFWAHPDFTELLGEAKLSAALTKSKSHDRWHIPVLLAMAASVLLMVCIHPPNLYCWQADYCTAVGETHTVSLMDGSQVTLNSDTALNVAYLDNVRHIELDHGEAYFSVQRNPLKPFVVASHYATIRVLGTRFLVRQNPHSDTVTVISGVVEVSGRTQAPTKLLANEQISVGMQTHDSFRQAAASNAAAWLKGHALFDNVPLPDVLVELNRYRHGAIVLSNSKLNGLKVSGRFDITDTDYALQALQETLPIRIVNISPWLVVIY